MNRSGGKKPVRFLSEAACHRREEIRLTVGSRWIGIDDDRGCDDGGHVIEGDVVLDGQAHKGLDLSGIARGKRTVEAGSENEVEGLAYRSGDVAYGMGEKCSEVVRGEKHSLGLSSMTSSRQLVV